MAKSERKSLHRVEVRVFVDVPAYDTMDAMRCATGLIEKELISLFNKKKVRLVIPRDVQPINEEGKEEDKFCKGLWKRGVGR